MTLRLHLTFLLALLLTLKENRLYAQDTQPTRLLRIYEDNDFFNVRGQGTDEAYTNGTRIDLFYTKKHSSRFFLDRIMPKAGDSSINIFGWGIMQIMITPRDLAKTSYQPDDYPYAGALFATHTLYSYDPVRKYDLQTEIIAGVMGPLSLAGPTQRNIHKMLNLQEPMGWENQLPNDLLLNINFIAEKQVFSYRPFIDVIGAGQVLSGTMINGLSAYSIIRIGQLSPYFNGYFSQYNTPADKKGNRKKIQAYFIIRPEAKLILTNALLQGSMFSPDPHVNYKADATDSPHPGLRRWVTELDYGLVVSSGHLSISYIQKTTTAYLKGLYGHEVGNLSLYYGW